MENTQNFSQIGICARCGKSLTQDEITNSEYNIENRPLCPSCNVNEANQVLNTLQPELRKRKISIILLLITLVIGGLIFLICEHSSSDWMYLGWLIMGIGGISSAENIFDGWIISGSMILIFYLIILLIAPVFAVISLIVSFYKYSKAKNGIEYANEVLEHHAQMSTIEELPKAGYTHTKKEDEYITMYRDFLADGDITEKERVRLRRYADALGITPERVAEIESE